MSSAYLLVSHGSRDPRPELAMKQLAGLVSENLPKNENLVGTATLELNSQLLREQIQEFARMAQACGYNCLEIIPLFLVPGVHVMRDIPTEVALAQQAMGEDIIIDLRPYLGTNSGLAKLLRVTMANIKAEGWILLAHGSRRPSSQEPVEVLAESLGAVAAYWSISPGLESRVRELIAAGCGEIAILPYVLFAGGITDAIAHSLLTLKLEFPAVNFQLLEPLGASTELANLIWELITEGEQVFG